MASNRGSSGSIMTDLHRACVKRGFGAIYIPYEFKEGTEIDAFLQMVTDANAISRIIGDMPGLLPADLSELESVMDGHDGSPINPIEDGWYVRIARSRPSSGLNYPPAPTHAQIRGAGVLASVDMVKCQSVVVTGLDIKRSEYRVVDEKKFPDVGVLSVLIADAYIAGYKAALTDVKRLNAEPSAGGDNSAPRSDG